MQLDPTSLYIALGFTALALTVTLMLNWLSVKADRFLLTWSVGVVVLVFAFCGYALYASSFKYELLWIGNVLLTAALLILYRSSEIFAGQFPSMQRFWHSAGVVLGTLTVPFLIGYDALGAIIGNFLNTGILLYAAWNFLKRWQDEPLLVGAIAGLYALAGLSFVPCGIMIAIDSPYHLAAPPDSWAVGLNTLAGVICMTAVGALSLAFNQSRAARQFEKDARTDPLTGLLNRRGLEAVCGHSPLEVGTGVIVFDLDEFKCVNDSYGHATGDKVLKTFAQVLQSQAVGSMVVARLGGEEFAMILPTPAVEDVIFIAEAVLSQFERKPINVGVIEITCTASAGVAVIGDEPTDLYSALKRADIGLYQSKSDGRNRVTTYGDPRAA